MGYKIRECRKEKKMSQCELAEKSGVSRTVISGLECGSITTTTTDTLLKIARALNKKVADIFFWNIVQHVEKTKINTDIEKKVKGDRRKGDCIKESVDIITFNHADISYFFSVLVAS